MIFIKQFHAATKNTCATWTTSPAQLNLTDHLFKANMSQIHRKSREIQRCFVKSLFQFTLKAYNKHWNQTALKRASVEKGALVHLNSSKPGTEFHVIFVKFQITKHQLSKLPWSSFITINYYSVIHDLIQYQILNIHFQFDCDGKVDGLQQIKYANIAEKALLQRVHFA